MYKTLYQLCELVSLRVAKAMSYDAVCSHNRQDLIHSIVPPHYVCNKLSNISIKTNNKGRNNIKKFVQHSEGDYILYMTSRLFVTFRSIALSTLLTLTCLTPHSNDMTSLQNSSAENITYYVAPFFYHHSVVILHLVSDTLYQTCYFL